VGLKLIFGSGTSLIAIHHNTICCQDKSWLKIPACLINDAIQLLWLFLLFLLLLFTVLLLSSVSGKMMQQYLGISCSVRL